MELKNPSETGRTIVAVAAVAAVEVADLLHVLNLHSSAGVLQLQNHCAPDRGAFEGAVPRS